MLSQSCSRLNGEDLKPAALHGAVLEKGNLRGWDGGREHEREEMSPEGGDEGCEDGEPMCREEDQEDAFGRHAREKNTVRGG